MRNCFCKWSIILKWCYAVQKHKREYQQDVNFNQQSYGYSYSYERSSRKQWTVKKLLAVLALKKTTKRRHGVGQRNTG